MGSHLSCLRASDLEESKDTGCGGTPSAAGAAPAGVAAPATLPSLPLDVLENICSHLTLWRDRLALVSCCQALWSRDDVAASTAIWGQLWLNLPLRRGSSSSNSGSGGGSSSSSGGGARLPSDPAPALPGWLRRRVPPAGGVVWLRPEKECLYDCVLGEPHRTPPPYLRRIGAGLPGKLLAVRYLDLSSCGLHRLPAPLAALPALRSLSLRANAGLGIGGDAAFETLPALGAVTSLSLADCGMCRLPRQLGALSMLLALDASSSRPCRAHYDQPSQGAKNELGAPDALRALGTLTTLQRLDLKCTGLGSLPGHLAALASLVELNVSRNPLRGEAAFGAATRGSSGGILAGLTQLTRLELEACGLRAVPWQLGSLAALARLNLRGNLVEPRLDPGSVWPLLQLPALQHLDLRGGSWPAAAAAAAAGAAAGAPALPAALAPLRQRGAVVLWDEASWGMHPG